MNLEVAKLANVSQETACKQRPQVEKGVFEKPTVDGSKSLVTIDDI